MAQKRKGWSRRTWALIWMLLVAVIMGVLIGNEQIALLYVLATLGLVALLLIVAFSDLEKVGVDDHQGNA